MSEMDLLVHPAIRESLGNVLIEAGLARVPVIASNVDGIPEVVVNGETGLLIDCTLPAEHSIRAPGASPLPKVVVDGRTRRLRPPLGPRPEELADAIVRLLRDSQLRRQMGKQARERMKRLFSIDRYARDLESAYRGDL
jgi:glycosyltransferase involved in cell wall biosynthesis